VIGAALALVGLYVGFLCQWDPPATPLAPLEIVRAPSVPGEATLLFAGDTAEADAALPILEARGFQYPFSLTVDLVRDADLAVANVEAPITDAGRRFPIWKQYTYRAPARSMDALAWAGFDLLTMANNHARDYLDEGIVDTIANAEARGLAVIGAGRDIAEARRGAIVTIGGVRVGLLAYLENQVLWRAWVDIYARRGHGGVAAAMRADVESDIRRLRPQCDVLVVSFHAGDNYAPPSASTIAWSRRAVELGADLVVNHHPHLVHPIMMHEGKPILLSIGNYAFGTPGWPELDYGYLALAHIQGRRLDRVEIVPLAVQNRRVEYRPMPLDEAESARALGELRARSAPLGADVRIERGRGVLVLGGAS
jgi:poly-gamma-glutamate synthesis protein (capsule biosynthesis protein)